MKTTRLPGPALVPRLMTLASLLASLLICSLPAHAAKQQYSIVAGSDEVCKLAQGFLNSEKTKLPAGFTLLAQPQTPANAKLPDPAQGDQLQNFDLDNDGIADQVFAHEGGGSYLLGTLFYVQHGKPGVALKANPTVADLSIYPCQFDPKVKKSASCPAISQEADEAGISFDISEDKSIQFRGRYTEMTPIRYQNKTWLVLVSASGDTRKYAALIEPAPNKRYRSACLFKHK